PGDPELLFRLDLDGESMRIPPGNSGYATPLHRAVAAHQILDRARDDVVQPRTAIRGRRSLEEDEGLPIGGCVQRPAKEVLLAPACQHLFLEGKERTGHLGIIRRSLHSSLTISPIRGARRVAEFSSAPAWTSPSTRTPICLATMTS